MYMEKQSIEMLTRASSSFQENKKIFFPTPHSPNTHTGTYSLLFTEKSQAFGL